MIVFDLQCGAGHVFEAWFGSSADYEAQREKNLVACPICGSEEVAKAVMAPAVPAKGNRKDDRPVPVSQDESQPEKVKKLLAELATEQAKMLEKSDYVGRKFADEARAMHSGERDHRSIHGETTADEARDLLDEGVPVAPLPLPIRPPKSEH